MRRMGAAPYLTANYAKKLTDIPTKEDFNKRMLLVHNRLRAEVARGDAHPQPGGSNMNKLQHSSVLASIATIWTGGLCAKSKEIGDWYMSHANNRKQLFQEMMTEQVQRDTFQVDFNVNSNQQIGENIAVFTHGPDRGAELDRFEYMATSWFYEHDYNLNNFMTNQASYHYVPGEFGVMTPEGSAGHYTALVWATERYVGCGWNFCNTHGDTWHLYLVCNYYPAGNWRDQSPYLQGTQCQNCDADRGSSCSTEDSEVGTGLCDGCMATDKFAWGGGGTTLATCNATAQEEHALNYDWSSASSLATSPISPGDAVSETVALTPPPTSSTKTATAATDATRNVVDFCVDCNDCDAFARSVNNVLCIGLHFGVGEECGDYVVVKVLEPEETAQDGECWQSKRRLGSDSGIHIIRVIARQPEQFDGWASFNQDIVEMMSSSSVLSEQIITSRQGTMPLDASELSEISWVAPSKDEETGLFGDLNQGNGQLSLMAQAVIFAVFICLFAGGIAGIYKMWSMGDKKVKRLLRRALQV